MSSVGGNTIRIDGTIKNIRILHNKNVLTSRTSPNLLLHDSTEILRQNKVLPADVILQIKVANRSEEYPSPQEAGLCEKNACSHHEQSSGYHVMLINIITYNYILVHVSYGCKYFIKTTEYNSLKRLRKTQTISSCLY